MNSMTPLRFSSLLDESVFLNDWFKDKYIFNSFFSPAKNKMHTQELIDRWNGILILQQVSDSWP